jgi:hypothetical protein
MDPEHWYKLGWFRTSLSIVPKESFVYNFFMVVCNAREVNDTSKYIYDENQLPDHSMVVVI